MFGLGHLAARLSGEPSIIDDRAPFLSDDDDIDRAVDAIIASDAQSG
jgi:S-DNA-T family DNA segregation ATPase FtsK/SpoIIIE